MKLIVVLGAILASDFSGQSMVSASCAQSDITLWNASETTGVTFVDSLVKLARSSNALVNLVSGKRANVLAQVRSTFPDMSEPCSACFADNVICGFTHCKSQCSGGASSKACISCNTKKCRPAFLECSGITDESLLPPNPQKKSKIKVKSAGAEAGSSPDRSSGSEESIEDIPSPTVVIEASASAEQTGDEAAEQAVEQAAVQLNDQAEV